MGSIKKFIVYSLVFFLFLSILYDPVISKLITSRVTNINQGLDISFPPFSPAAVPPFGTDVVGFTVVSKLIQGFKYTFFISFGLSLFQVCLSFLIAYSLTTFLRFTYFIYYFFDKLFLFIPKPFTLILLLTPVYIYGSTLSEQNSHSSVILIILQIMVLFVIGLPNSVLIFYDELLNALDTEFAEASILLGRNKKDLLFYSLRPQITAIVINIFFKTTIQNLSLFIYMAYFGFFLGGALNIEIDLDNTYNTSLSNEWSGLIGMNIKYLAISPWTTMIPLFFYILFIYMLKQLNDLISKEGIRYK